jgi:tetratricopeptide (TPR) repeat protein
MDEARSHLERRGPGVINVGDPIVDNLQTLVRGERGLVVQGRRAYEAAKYQEAADAFTRAIAAAPNSSTARVNLAMAQLQLGDTTAAVTHLQAAFDLAPDDPDVSRELLRVLLRLGRQDEAIALLTKSRTARPDDEDLAVGLAILLAQNERFGEAVTLLDDANRQYPDRIATATTLARLLASSPDRSQRDGKRALDLATRVYKTAPTPAHGETLALALAELERCGEALTWIKRAVEEASRAGDAEETTRLKDAMRKYESTSCRP